MSVIELKRAVVVTPNPQSEPNPETLQLDHAALHEVFKLYDAVHGGRLTSAGPGGSFKLEPSQGLFEYLGHVVRRERGVISHMASISTDGETVTLTVGHEEFEQGLAEYRVLVQNEHRRVRAEFEAIGSELVEIERLTQILAG